MGKGCDGGRGERERRMVGEERVKRAGGAGDGGAAEEAAQCDSDEEVRITGTKE
eukprot:CAMPEP_0113693718 /NCGR_PEP_ID=MMETSP0038_2-20120614/19837_1 /TAXON_ID=2898 /ORGANISM="Cryptomonas paramecium" /LENGTH=53 /DNA_ID=CAMNT_0000615855 /DNA_START=99 /DNA_END=258 /DNA_ORIENTATION=- /assembly_acc=CAM_ASM_000170